MKHPALVAGGVSAAAAAALTFALTRPAVAAPTPTPCTGVSCGSVCCPSGDVCPVGGLCPSGYVTDTANPGCCAPGPAPCPEVTCGSTCCPSGDVCPSGGVCPTGYESDPKNPGCCVASSPPTSGAVGSVTFTGPTSNGQVTWIFSNTGTVTGSWVFVRGVSQNGVEFENYPFGGAFNVMYLYNASLFGTYLLTAAPTVLVDNGPANNVPPLGIVDSPSGRSLMFVFTLAPGQTWSMYEYGFTNGYEPVNPTLYPVTVKDSTSKPYCYTWDSQQCYGYDQQTGQNLPCPGDPWTITGILLQTTASLPLLFPADTITAGAC
jgi:hypothetical protein